MLREVLLRGYNPFEIVQIEGAERGQTTAKPRPELTGQTIERVLKPEDVRALDSNGKTVPAKTVAERLKNWTPVFIEYEYSDLQDRKQPSEKPIRRENPHPSSSFMHWQSPTVCSC